MNTVILPPKMKIGDTIGIIAPADPVQPTCLPQVIKRGYDYLLSKGFIIREGASVKENFGHTAGTIEQRISDIHNFVTDPSVTCIMAFWGGLNTNQLLDRLDYKLIRKHPKIFIGFSDITALTTAIHTKTGLITFSGPGIISFGQPHDFHYTWDYFKKILIEPKEIIPVDASSIYADDSYFLRDGPTYREIKNNAGLKTFSAGKAEAEIIAGNLQTLLLLTGTPYEPSVDGKILFLEEDGSSTPAHLERYLTQAKQLGWFEKISGLVFGRFTTESGFTENDSLIAIMERIFHNKHFPILYNADFGHSDPLFTIPHGGTAVIDANSKQIFLRKSVV